jgi:hypothetical protein
MNKISHWERVFSINKAQKEGLCSVRAFWDPKSGKFLGPEELLFKYLRGNVEQQQRCISRNASVTRM